MLALSVGLGSAAVAVGSTTAGAATCDEGVNCAPANVVFYEQATQPYATGPTPGNGFYESEIQVCGLEGSFAPLSARRVDVRYDHGLAGDGPTTEGNYVDSEPFGFKPTTSLAARDTITIRMPHPNQPNTHGGSVLPPRQVSTRDTHNPRSPLWLDSNVVADAPVSIDSTTESARITVTMANVTTPERLQLKVWDPYNPPKMAYTPQTDPYHFDSGFVVDSSLQITSNNPDPGDSNNTVAKTTGGATNAASWTITSQKKESLVFSVDLLQGSTGENFEERLDHTATVDFFKGGPTTSTQRCSGAQLAAPSFLASGYGATYLIVEKGVGYFADASVSHSGGGEIARITVPDGVPTADNNTKVYVVALDALSPPGRGTPEHPVTPTYGRSAYSISTTKDPVAAHPTTPPTFQANFPLDVTQSTLTMAEKNAPAGPDPQNRAIVTLRDPYQNPLNGKPVELVPGTAVSAVGTHVPPSVIALPTQAPSGEAQYENTGDDGIAQFDLADSCAERVPFTAVAVEDVNSAPIGKYDKRTSTVRPVSTTWLPGPAVAPDGHKSRANCGYAPIRSSVNVTRSDHHPFAPGVLANNPADGASAAVVTVTAGDRFGNPAACQPVTLTTTAKISTVQITPLVAPLAFRPHGSLPCPGGEQAGYTNRLGDAQFEVTDSLNTILSHSLPNDAATFNVTFGSPVSIWPYGSNNTKDVARIQFEPPSWTASTVVPEHPSAPSATGTTDSLTITLLDRYGNPVVNQNVAVSGCKSATLPDGFGTPCSSSSTVIIEPATPGVTTTDLNGQVSFAVGDTVAETVYFVVRDTTQPICDAECGPSLSPVSIDFTPGGVSLGANPVTLIGDDHATTTVTLNLFDTNRAPFDGYSLAGLDLPPGVRIVDASGPPLQLTLSGTAVGPATVTAHITYFTQPHLPCFGVVISAPGVDPAHCLAQASTTLSFVSPPQRFALSASPTSAAADGFSASVVYVTALDGDGHAIPGLPVSLSATSGHPLIFASQPVTDALGRAYFSVTDTSPEPVTLTATYAEIGTTAPTYSPPGCNAATPCTVMVAFTDTEASLSTVTVAPSTIAAGAPPPARTCPAATCATVTVTLKEMVGATLTPINGDVVALFTGSSTTTVTPSNAGGVSGQTAAGQVAFYVSDTKPGETLVVYARDLSTGVVLNATVTITTT